MEKLLKLFFRDKSGNAAIAAGILGVPLIVTSGIGFDYAYIARLESKLQGAVDAAAMAGAKEMALSGADKQSIMGTAEAYIYTNAEGVVNPEATSISVSPSEDRVDLRVDVAHVWKPLLLHYISDNVLPLKVSATASLAGKGTICMLGLDEIHSKVIHLSKKAQLEAPGCGIYANSPHANAITIDDDAKLTTGVTCSAGGVKAKKKSAVEPEPITDCPAVDDPLAGRPVPVKGSCDYNDFEISSGFHTLYPGTYCGGLKVKGDAEASLRSGIYYIEGGNLEVTDKATFEGENVGFFLAGNDAKLKFKKETSIGLTAPKSGLMAGILAFEDPAASEVYSDPSNPAADDLKKHEITSDDARLLLGTIYLPNGTLKIDSDGPVADQSAYTAILARKIELKEGPTLYLNSDYEATDVPVPEGLTKNEAYLKR